MILLLTATPHQGDEKKFLNILKLLDPYRFKNTYDLRPKNIETIVIRNPKRAAVDFSGNPIFKDRLTSMIKIPRDAETNQEEIELYRVITEYTSEFFELARQKSNQAMAFVIMLYQKIVSSSSAALFESLSRRKAVLSEALENNKQIQTKRINNPLDEDLEEWLEEKILWKEKELLELELRFLDQALNLAEKIKSRFADAKLGRLIKLIKEIRHRENNEDVKIIIFVQFKGTQKYLLEYLKRYGFDCAFINGDLSLEKKIEQSSYFRESAQILVSTDAGGEGINLQFCHVMINFDLPWNPTKLEQRIGRIDRIGQEKDILVFNFSLTDTIEDDVREILEEKLDLIKKQFGEDKYEEVLSLIQEEFSFDELYMAALEKEKREKGSLEKLGEQLYTRASEIVSKNQLLIPYTQERTPKYTIKNIVEECLRPMVESFFAYEQIQPQYYKSDPYVFFFENPFKKTDPDQPAIFRKATFNTDLSSFRDDLTLLSIKHPFVKKLFELAPEKFHNSDAAALELKLSKFAGKSGLLFYYLFEMSNQIDKDYKEVIPVFIDFETNRFNRRISNIFLNLERMEISIIPNYKPLRLEQDYLDEARQAAQKEAEEIYFAKKLKWNRQIDKHTEKIEEYYGLKKQAVEDIRIENIRTARLKDLYKQYAEEMDLIKKKKNIVPNLQALQTAYIEVKS